MKDADVQWLGGVPEHWEIRRLKQICRLEYGDSLVSEIRQDGSVPVFGSNGCVGSHIVKNTLGPCVIVGRKGSFGKVHYSPDSAFAIDTTFFVDRRFSAANIRWLYFLLGWLRLDEVNKDSAVPGLDRGDAYQRLAPFPPVSEQVAIVRFLDHVNNRIDRYIRAKEKLISLLKEQKQAIIHEAVTGRIDVRTGRPYPAYKPSNLDWLSDIPNDWTLRRFKFVAQINRGQIDPRDVRQREKVLVSPNHIESGVGEISYQETAAEQGADSGKYEVKKGQIIYSKIRPNLRKAAIATDDCLCSADMYPISADTNELRSRYFLYLLLSIPFTRYAVDCSLRVAMPKVNRETLGESWLWYPTIPEQDKILEFIEQQCRPVDQGIGGIRQELDLLREYRDRLIADVVTGKLDVRDVAAQIPETGPSMNEGSIDAGQAGEGLQLTGCSMTQEESR